MKKNIISRKHFTGVLLGLMVLGSMVSAQVSIVVAKHSTHTAPALDLKQFFTGSKLQWEDGEKVLIVEQSGSAINAAFYKSFLGASLTQVHTGWTKLVLSGQAHAPRKCVDDAAVKKTVSESPNAVGFISSSSLDDSVKEIYRVIAFVRE